MRLTEILLGVLVALVLGLGIVFAKSGIGHFPPMLLMGMRSILAAALLIWFTKPPYGSLVQIFFIALISGTLQFSLVLYGLKDIDASIAALVVQLEAPFLIFLGIVFLKEKTCLRKLMGMCIAFFGIVILLGEPRFAGSWLSFAMLLGGAMAWAVGQILVKTLDNVDGRTIVTWVALSAAPQLLLASLFFEEGQIQAIASADRWDWFAVIYLGVIMTAIGYGIWYTLLQRHPVSSLAPFMLLMPIFSVLGGVLFLGEQLTFHASVGGIIIISGVAFVLSNNESKTES